MEASSEMEEGVTNALSFDVEHWYTATLLRDEVTEPEDHIERSVEIVLDLLDSHDVRATFFVVGQVATEYPALVKEIVEAGHEIASHGHSHTPLYDLTADEFERELSESRSAIEDATGVEPDGFRAPNFSISRETDWAFSTLQSSQYRYDSSVFPMKTPLYGVRTSQLRPYTVRPDEPFDGPGEGEPESNITEWPLSVTNTTPRVPIAGGFYARTLPSRFLTYGIRRLNRHAIPANIYFHPWELNPDVRTDEPPFIKRAISFHGTDKCQQKLSTLLSRFEFDSIGSLLEQRGFLDADESQNEQTTSKSSNYIGQHS